MDADFELLLEESKKLVYIKKVLNEYTKIAAVGCALMTDSRNIYTGISVEVVCGIGFCAEHAAIAEMLKHNETRILKIVAISQKEVRSPCGRCREFMRLINSDNLEAEILLPNNLICKLKELLPYPFHKSKQ